MRNFIFIIGAVILLSNLKAQVLNVPQVIQEQDNWCWAATTRCILNYYGFAQTQCLIADYTRSVSNWHNFGAANCCQSTTQGCNYWNYAWGYSGSIEDILNHFGKIITNNRTGTLTIDEIQSEINDGRPFMIRWGWSTGGGHFVVGYGISGNDIYFMNPLPGYGSEIANYNWLINDGSHTWTHSQTLCMPATPGLIAGNSTVCRNSIQTYSIDLVPGATTYSWTLPPGWKGNLATRSIQVTAGYVGGIISVTANNNCGKSLSRTFPVTVSKIDLNVSQSNSILTADASPAQYQWISCEDLQPIAGATGQSYTANKSGVYAVVVTQSNCSDTSNCFLVTLTDTKNANQLTKIEISPNPVNDILNMNCKNLAIDNYTFSLINEFGQKLMSKTFRSEYSSFNLQFELKSIPSGLYYILMHSSSGQQVYPFQKI